MKSAALRSIRKEPRHDAWPYRMRDLCEISGLPRQAIHFYIQQGLLPPSKKTGKNTALYGEAHVERLALVKKLQHERFLPLRAIKALLDGEEDAFTGDQRRFLADVKRELAPQMGRAKGRTVSADELLERTGVGREELERTIELGLVGAARGAEGEMRVPEADAWVLENLARMRVAGLTRELGFDVDDLVVYAEAIDVLFNRERELLAERLSHLPPAEVARMIQKVLPIIHDCIVRQHESRVRQYFTQDEGES